LQQPPDRKLSTHLHILSFLMRFMGVGSLITAGAALLSFAVMSEHWVLLVIGVGCAIVGFVLLVVKLPQPEEVERMFGKRRD